MKSDLASEYDNEIRVWFGGGDEPRHDENLHGQIGYGVLRPVR